MIDTIQLKIPKIFRDEQVEELEKWSPLYRSRALNGKCPTCEDTGIYKNKGEEYMCEQDDWGHTQRRLFMLYCLANVPNTFMGLPWEEFPHVELKDKIDFWTNHYPAMRREGLGFEIFGSHGTGKTWAAAHMLMEVVKQGYSGFFIQFADMKSLYEESAERREHYMTKIRESEVLVIDEITEPWSAPMREFYEEKLESALRFRAHSNFPTITTTNMTVEEYKENYPRVYAQLSEKQQREKVSGIDYRPFASDAKQERILNGEVLPIV